MCLPPLAWGRKQVQFSKRSVLLFLEYWTMNNAQKPSNPNLTDVLDVLVEEIVVYFVDKIQFWWNRTTTKDIWLKTFMHLCVHLEN
jgi:hypothetical protein